MPTPSKYYTPTRRFVTSTGNVLHPGYPLRYCGQMVDRIQLRDDDGNYYHITEAEFELNMELLPASQYRAFKRGQRFAAQLIDFTLLRPVRFLKRLTKGFLKIIGALIEGMLEGLGSLFD